LAFTLRQNYPNPFNPNTTISYELPRAGNVSLKITNTLGQVISTLEDGYKEAGFHQLRWNASNVPSGIYFYRLQAGEFVETKKMVLLR
jgi:flagellar hook assembly protein FlgD